MTEQSSPQDHEAETAEASAEERTDAVEAEAAPYEDLGENAHDVVVSLLNHQQDLIVELRTVYDRLDEVREVEFRQLESRVESTIGELQEAPSQLAALRGDLESTAQRVQELGDLGHAKAQESAAAVSELQERLASREAQIDELSRTVERLSARLDETAAEAAEAHRRLEVIAQETNSSLLSALPGRAKSSLEKVSRRFRR